MSYQEYPIDKLILLLFTLLISLFYYLIRRCSEYVKFINFAEKSCFKDPLTKLYNRRAFESKLLLEWQRFRRYKQPFCLIMVHIDDFKLINDSFGHQEGDRVIVEVSEKLLGNIRKNDFCARWSGADFLIFCPVGELVQTVALAERLRADVYRIFKNGVELSVSLGVTQVGKQKSLDELLSKVELQLYQAKKTGGNCVVSA
jgi:diguanylate cyclase (GGDEF)-like protein